MELNEYQKQAHKTLAGNEQVLTNLSLGLASDTGQVIDRIKGYTFQGQDLDYEQLKDDLGDVLWYLSQIALWAEIPLEDVATANLKAIAKRYPTRR